MTNDRVEIGKVAAVAVDPTPVPRQAKRLKLFVDPIYRFFDWLYGSEFNPLYRSGTLAVGFLCVLLLTGLYLSFFYSVSQPYESIVALHEQVWAGRWVRTLHRYATVATVAAIFFHILQLLVQGKSWGPRTLAWVSGVALTAMFFLSAWSGYVMVWDVHGQRVAIAGAEMLAVIPMLRDVVRAAFDGAAEIPPGFFFMNLFLHVALPVAMIMFLWIHTARLSRAVWLPKRSILGWTLVGLLVTSVVLPVPLLERANLLRLVGRIPTDLSTGFWMSWATLCGTPLVWCILSIGVGLLLVVPWWWRPGKSAQRQISAVDADACTGCMQCVKDCPYEAIQMVPRTDGKRMIAEIIPNHCVSCGICAASCADFAIGPPGRSAVDQRTRVQAFCANAEARKAQIDIVLISCANNPGLAEVLEKYQVEHPEVAIYPVECCGCVHTEVLEQLLKVSKGIASIGCPARNCFNRDGGELLAERIFEKRVPFLDRALDRRRLLIAAFSESERRRVLHELESFRSRLCVDFGPLVEFSVWQQRLRAGVMSILLLILCAFVAQMPNGVEPSRALIRVAGMLPSFAAKECHMPSEEELQNTPQHMRPKEICSHVPLNYEVSIWADSREIMKQGLGRADGRVDQALYLDMEAPLTPGRRHLEVSISSGGEETARCAIDATLVPGQVILAHYERLEGTLICRS